MTGDKQKLFGELTELFDACEGNVIPEEEALPGCAGLVMFERPLFGVSAADDPVWETFRLPDVIGDNFLPPEEWLPGARSVLSFYLPFSERVRASNRGDPENTSPEWLHARIEGQTFINAYTERIRAYFEGRGGKACVPALDPRFAVRTTPLPEGDPKGVHIASNWSERHVAYASGLGTFCLTRGLISKKGVAGRYGSVIVTEAIEPDARPYTGVYEWCARCGACVARCPAGAMSPEGGKDQIRINSVCPGIIQTAMLDSFCIDHGIDPVEFGRGSAVLGRLAQPIEVAKASLWLCTDDASYVTATNITVDGGYCEI